MPIKEKSRIMATRIYSSRCFGVYGRGNFDLSLEELSELLHIAMSGADDEERSKRSN